MQHAFPDAGGGDEPSRPQGPGLARDGGRADFQRLGELGGGALTGGEPEQIGAGAAEQPDEGSVPDDSRTGSGAAAG